jgi:type IV pilus assembly protein PilY1
MKASNYCIKAASVTLSVVIALALAASSAWAGVCDFPLPIQRTMANGNVLFILDSSGSMNEILYHSDYDPNTVYAGPLDATTLYGVKQDGYFAPDDFQNGLETTPEIYLVNSDNSYEGLYTGNYLNWLFYHATQEQINSMPLITRIQAEKAVMHELLDEFNPEGAPTGTLRFGFFTFNASGAGGNLMSKIGSPREVMLNAVDGVSAKGPTPLAETLVDVIDYLSLTGNLAPIEYTCQKTFVVLLTDGYPTDDLNVPAYIGDWDGDGREPGTCESIGAPNPNTSNCSDYLDDVAGYLNELDLRPDLDEVQNAPTYVVGFNVDAPLLAQTAANGDGLYMTANSVEELKSALTNVLRDIIKRISSGSAVAIVSVEGESEDHLLRAKYLPVAWQGYLEAFALPYEDGDRSIWEAGALLADRSAASRRVYTVADGIQIDFTDSQADQLYERMNLATPDEAARVINWVRGENVPGLRYRGEWKLGDIVDSSPVVVGAPSSFHLDEEYMSFRVAHADRPRTVYIGANDGMLHTFDENTGQELWALIPESHLPRLKNLADTTYCHEYFVNLTPKVQDVYLRGQWRTVLFGGMKHGGDGFFAVDVTDPEYPEFLWESRIPTVIESWTQPEIVRVRGLNKTLAIVGSGPDYAGDAYVMALDVDDGSVLWTDLLSKSAEANMATAAEAVDIDYDGYEDVFYVSDLAGHVWRYDLDSFPPQRSLLFTTEQPIQAEPVLTVDYNNDVLLYFGTGRYIDTMDFIDISQQTFYCIIDNHGLTSVTRSNLVDQTTSIHPITSNDRGWYVDLVLGEGERVVEPDALVAGVIYFTSFKPMAERCEFGGFSWLYAMDFRNAAAVDGDDDSGNDTADGRSEELGEGIVSRPVIDIVNEDVVIQGSDTRIHVRDAQGVIQQLIVRSWRQIYD